MEKRWISILLSFMIILQGIGVGSTPVYGETLENTELLRNADFIEAVEEPSQSVVGDEAVTSGTVGEDTGDSIAESYVEAGVGAAAVTSGGLIEDENVLSGNGTMGTGANEAGMAGSGIIVSGTAEVENGGSLEEKDETDSLIQGETAESETELPGTSGAMSGAETETELSEAEKEGIIEEETETDGLMEDLSLADGEEMEIITVTETVELEDPSVASGRFSASPRTYSLTEYDGCYGNQLSGSTRMLYDARVSYYVSGRNTGDMVLTYSKSTSPYVFDAVVNKDESNKSSIDKTTEEYLAMKEQVLFDIQSSLDAFLYDHPEIFWLRGGKCTYSVSAVGSSASGYVGYVSKMTYTPSVAFDGAEELISAYDAAVAVTVSEIAAGADADGDGVTSNLELATAAHDYLCSRLWYDSASYATYQETEDYRIFSSAGAFLDSAGSGVVCEGYAKAYKVLCDQMGIPCVLIGGTVVQSSGTIGHMWNAVQIHGEWYLTDVTWDDGSSGISYKYFLVGNITTNRYSSGNFSGAETGTVFVYPSLETTAFEAVADMLHRNVFASETEDACGGYRYVDCICAECGYHYQEYTMGEHDYQPTEVVGPDCTTPGYTIYTCKYCNDSYKQEQEALGHNYVVTDSVSAACENDGYIIYTCSRCGDSYKQEIEALDHDYMVTEKREPTCELEGYIIYTCSHCQDSYKSDMVEALGHDYMVTEKNEPTCELEGYTIYTCSHCQDSYKSDMVDALGHDYEETDRKEATCEEEGYILYTCTRSGCGHSYTEHIEPSGHDYETTVAAPTCISGGYTTYICSRCGASYIGDYKAALGHNYVNGVCSRCGIGASIANAAISALPAQAYTGKAVTPAITVSFGTNVLKAGTDYTVTWSSNKNPGTAYVTITGKGNYSGSVTKSFSITKRSVASLTCSSISNRVYNGKTRKPSLTIKNGSVRLIAGQDYTVSYSKNTNVGRAVITVTGKGNYTGTKKVYFNIIPRTPTLTRVRSASSRKLTVLWKKVAGVTGYQIQYSTGKTFKTCKTVTVNAKNLSKTISKLTGGKAYYVRVRSYKKVSGKNYFSSWSASKKVKVKK